MKKIFAIIGLILFIGGFVFYLYERDKQEVQGAVINNGPISIIGSRTSPDTFIATTTVGVPFANNSATSTYYATSSNADSATFRLKAVAASTTAQGPNVHLSFYGSSDTDCMTAITTTTSRNQVVRNDINWYDIGANQLNLDSSATIPSGTSTKSWIPYNGQGETITFTNLSFECLKVEASASGTQLFMSLTTKGNY